MACAPSRSPGRRHWPETLNRIEQGTTSPSVATVAKIDRALPEAEDREDSLDMTLSSPAVQVNGPLRGT